MGKERERARDAGVVIVTVVPSGRLLRGGLLAGHAPARVVILVLLANPILLSGAWRSLEKSPISYVRGTCPGSKWTAAGLRDEMVVSDDPGPGAAPAA